jgi:hypothetical protein
VKCIFDTFCCYQRFIVYCTRYTDKTIHITLRRLIFFLQFVCWSWQLPACRSNFAAVAGTTYKSGQAGGLRCEKCATNPLRNNTDCEGSYCKSPPKTISVLH